MKPCHLLPAAPAAQGGCRQPSSRARAGPCPAFLEPAAARQYSTRPRDRAGSTLRGLGDLDRWPCPAAPSRPQPWPRRSASASLHKRSADPRQRCRQRPRRSIRQPLCGIDHRGNICLPTRPAGSGVDLGARQRGTGLRALAGPHGSDLPAGSEHTDDPRVAATTFPAPPPTPLRTVDPPPPGPARSQLVGGRRPTTPAASKAPACCLPPDPPLALIGNTVGRILPPLVLDKAITGRSAQARRDPALRPSRTSGATMPAHPALRLPIRATRLLPSIPGPRPDGRGSGARAGLSIAFALLVGYHAEAALLERLPPSPEPVSRRCLTTPASMACRPDPPVRGANRDSQRARLLRGSGRGTP